MAIVVGKRLFGDGCFEEGRKLQLSCIHLVSFLWEEVLPVNVCCCFGK